MRAQNHNHVQHDPMSRNQEHCFGLGGGGVTELPKGRPRGVGEDERTNQNCPPRGAT